MDDADQTPQTAERPAIWRTLHRPRAYIALVGSVLGVLLLVAGMVWLLQLPSTPAAAPTSTPLVATPASRTPVGRSFRFARTLESAGVLYMAWAPDGHTLATGQGNTVEVWEATTGSLRHSFDLYAVSSLAWDTAGRFLAVGDSGNSVHILDPQAGAELHPPPANLPATPNADTAWSPDGRLIASRFVDRAPVSPSAVYDAIRLWNPSSGATVRVIPMPPRQEGSPPGAAPVLNVAWSSDGRYLATFSQYADVRIWDTATGTLLQTFTPAELPRFEQAPPVLAWQPGGTVLAVIAGRAAELWDARTGQLLRALPDVPPPPPPVPTAVPTGVDPLHPAPSTPPPAVPTNAQGQPIRPPLPGAGASATPTPTYVYQAQGYRALGGLAWAPDGHALASFDGPYIRLWDPATGRQVQRLRTAGPVIRLAWSPDGAVLASLDGVPAKFPAIQTMYPNALPPFYDGTVRVWDVGSGQEIATILPGQVSDFVWSSDGHTLLVRTGTTAAIWSTTGQGPTDRPTLHPGPTTPATPAAGTPTAPCGSWSLVPAPSIPAQESDLRAVTLAGPDDAWAVGYHSASPRDPATQQLRDARTLTLHWQGSRWDLVPSPNLGSGDNVLNGVVALAPADAWAVGYAPGPAAERRALILHWDGARWQPVPTPGLEARDSSLNAVAGRAANDVWAVGTVGGKHTLTLHWDGTAWSRIASPSPGIALNELTAVYATAQGVWVAGTYLYRADPIGAPQGTPLILHWDGNRWQPVAVPFAGTNASAIAVSGSGAGWLVGGYAGEGGGGGAISRLDSQHSEIVPLPPLAPPDAQGVAQVPDSGLNGLAVLAPDDAWAVGHFSDYGPGYTWQVHTLTLYWDGVAWSRMPSLDAGRDGSALAAVAALPGQVWAVGHAGPYNTPHALILRFGGPWCSSPTPAGRSPTPAPSAPPARSTVPPTQPSAACSLAWRYVPDDNAGPLHAVAVLPGGTAWAAGGTNGPLARTLLKRWDGVRWVQVPSPSEDQANSILYGLAARAADDVWAVGAASPPRGQGTQPGTSTPLVLHWNGATWQIAAVPDPGGIGGVLQAVAAVAADDVWAVGRRALAGSAPGKERVETLIVHWDGTQWRVIASPNPGKLSSELRAIAVAASDDIWAVGSFSDGGPEFIGATKTLILHWDGAQWRQVAGPNVAAWINSLSGVIALAADDAWAVGDTNGGEHTDPLILHWDGRIWRIVPSPPSGSHNGGWLSGIAAAAAQDIWAVGGDNPVPLLEHWDGAQWRTQPIAPAGDNRTVRVGALAAVGIAPSGQAWAVGADMGSPGASTLALRLSNSGCTGP